MIVAILFLLFAQGCASTRHYEFAFERYAIVQDKKSISSAVRIGRATILSAEHTVKHDSVLVFTTQRNFVSTTKYFVGELAFIYGDDLFMDTVEVSDVFLGMEVCWVQPRFEKGGGVFLTFGRVSAIADSSIYLDRPVMYGVSGSGVWALDGKLVGVMQAIIALDSFPMYSRATRLSIYWKRGVP